MHENSIFFRIVDGPEKIDTKTSAVFSCKPLIDEVPITIVMFIDVLIPIIRRENLYYIEGIIDSPVIADERTFIAGTYCYRKKSGQFSRVPFNNTLLAHNQKTPG